MQEMNTKIEDQKIKCSVEDSFCNTSIREKWNQLVKDCNSTIYMSFDWCRIWWEHYADNRKLMLFYFYNDFQLIGVLPMYLEIYKIGPIKIRISRIIGSKIAPKIFNPPIISQWAENVFNIFLETMYFDYKCNFISFGPISSNYRLIESLNKLCSKKKKIIDSYDVSTIGIHSLFNLQDNFENYLNSLTKKERKNRLYELKKLEKKFNIKVELVQKTEEIENEFQKFIKMHTKQWHAQGRPGHFEAWPDAENFNVALVKEFAQQGKLQLLKIASDETVISYQYGFLFGDCLYWQLPARALDEVWSKYSTGNISVILMIKNAIENKVRKIEAGIGHYEYKTRLGAIEYPVKCIRIITNSKKSLFILPVLFTISWIFNIGYYKIWYRRIQPKLPPYFQWPILKVWIKYML